MKNHHITTLILATLILTANAEEQLCGTDKQDLTEQVNSVIFGKSEMEIAVDGTQATQKFTSKTSITSKPLDNHNIVISTDVSGKPKACISIENAYRPYLNTLDSLVRTLKLQTQKADKNSCKSINEIYNSIYELERVLNNPVLANTQIQTEYQTLKKEYQPDTTSRIFLEIKENIFGEQSNVITSKLKEILSTNNCRIEQNICKTKGGFTLRINATACNHKNDGTFDHCSSCLKIDLLNGRNEIILSPSVATKAAWDSRAVACEKAFELSAPEIFSKIRDRIGEVCE